MAILGHLLSDSQGCCGRLTGILKLITPISDKIERKKGAGNNKNILEDHRCNKKLWGLCLSLNCTMHFKWILFNRLYLILNVSACFWVTFYTKANQYYFIYVCVHKPIYT